MNYNDSENSELDKCNMNVQQISARNAEAQKALTPFSTITIFTSTFCREIVRLALQRIKKIFVWLFRKIRRNSFRCQSGFERNVQVVTADNCEGARYLRFEGEVSTYDEGPYRFTLYQRESVLLQYDIECDDLDELGTPDHATLKQLIADLTFFLVGHYDENIIKRVFIHFWTGGGWVMVTRGGDPCLFTMPLVGVETNPGPDYASPAFQNLSGQNNKKHVKKCKNMKTKALSQRHAELQKEIKKQQKRKVSHAILVGIETNPGPISEEIATLNSQLRELNLSSLGAEAQVSLFPQVPVSHSLSEETQETIDKLSNTLDRFVNLVSNDMRVKDVADIAGKGLANGIIEQIGQQVATLFKDIDVMKVSGFVIIVICSILVSRSERLTMTHKVVIIALFSFFGVALGLDLFKKEDEDFEFQAQASSDSMLEISGIALMTYFFPWSDMSVSKIIQSASLAERSTRGVTQAMNVVIKLLQRIMDYLARTCGFPTFSLLSANLADVDLWLKDVRTFLTSLGKPDSPKTRSTYDQLTRLEDRGHQILGVIAHNREFSHITGIVRPLLGALAQAKIDLEMKGVCTAKTRQVSVIVALGGTSHIGKSASLRPSIATLANMLCPADELQAMGDNIDQLVYAYMPENVYHDGYNGQWATFIDEYGMMQKQHVTGDNQSTFLIRAGNVFPYLLHMANLNQKGNTYFRSKVIICTTNRDCVYNVAKEEVSYPEAVINRIHFEYRVSIKPKYATEESLKRSGLSRDDIPQNYNDTLPLALDKKRLPDHGLFESDIYLYYRLRYRKETATVDTIKYDTESPIDYVEMLRQVGAKYRELELESQYVATNDTIAANLGRKLRYEAQAGGSGIDSEHVQFLIDSESPPEEIYEYVSQFPLLRASDLPERERPFFDRLPAWEFVRHELLTFNPSYMKRIIGAFDIRVDEYYVDGYGRVRKFCAEKWEKLQSRLDSWLFQLGKARTQLCALIKKYIHPELPTVIKLVGGGTALTLAYFAISGLVNMFLGESEEVKKGPFEAQISDKAFDGVVDKVLKNYYEVLVNDHRLGYGFFLKDNSFMCPAHFKDVIEAREMLSNDVELYGPKDNFVVSGDMFWSGMTVGDDLYMTNVTNTRKHGDISHLLVDHSTLGNRRDFKAYLIRFREGRREYNFVNANSMTNFEYTVPNARKSMKVKGYIYDLATFRGECGSPLFALDSTLRNCRFLGFHVAGRESQGFSTSFSSFKKFEAQAFEAKTMIKIGTVSRAPGTSGFTQIKRSELYGMWGPAKKAPARLKDFDDAMGVRISPIVNALKKYDRPIITYDEDILRPCISSAVANIVNCSTWRTPNRMSLENAVLGIDGVEYMDAIARNTSPGYPWCMTPLPGYKGKERFFGNGPEITFDGPDWPKLEQEINECLSKLEAGERPEWYYNDSLKDELVSLEKVALGKTRLFCPSPVSFSIIFNMFFKEFFVEMVRGRLRNESAIGINVYSEEWEFLYRKLTRFGANNIFAGDFSGFDTDESAQLLRELGEEIFPLFGDPQYTSIRRILWMEIWNSKHIVGKNIYEWMQSLPSGNPATANINTLVHMVYMRLFFVRAHNDDVSCLREFEDNVSEIIYGDDGVVNVSDKVKDIFNQHTCTEIASSFGLTYTGETKGELPPPLRPIDEVAFLKRKWRYEPYLGRHVAPISMDTIREMPYWTKKTMSTEITKQNLDNAIRELSLHDRETFDSLAPLMLAASREKINFQPLITDKYSLLKEIVRKEIDYRRG